MLSEVLWQKQVAFNWGMQWHPHNADFKSKQGEELWLHSTQFTCVRSGHWHCQAPEEIRQFLDALLQAQLWLKNSPQTANSHWDRHQEGWYSKGMLDTNSAFYTYALRICCWPRKPQRKMILGSLAILSVLFSLTQKLNSLVLADTLPSCSPDDKHYSRRRREENEERLHPSTLALIVVEENHCRCSHHLSLPPPKEPLHHDSGLFLQKGWERLPHSIQTCILQASQTPIPAVRCQKPKQHYQALLLLSQQMAKRSINPHLHWRGYFLLIHN